MKPSKKIQARLDARLKDHAATIASRSDSKVQQRKETGGYRKPGSMKKI